MQNPTDVDFSEVTLWVQFHNVPIACMESSIIRRLGERVGKVVDVEVGDGSLSLGRVARAKVSRRVDQPLMRCIPLADETTNKEVLVLLQYERLSDFCFACGRLGHISKDCDDTSADKKNFQFDEWLRAGAQFAGRRKGGEHGASIPKHTEHKEALELQSRSMVEDRDESRVAGREVDGGKRDGKGVVVREEGEEMSEDSSRDEGGGENMSATLGTEGGNEIVGQNILVDRDQGTQNLEAQRVGKSLSPKKARRGKDGAGWK